jgi:hypothetical protein
VLFFVFKEPHGGARFRCAAHRSGAADDDGLSAQRFRVWSRRETQVQNDELRLTGSLCRDVDEQIGKRVATGKIELSVSATAAIERRRGIKISGCDIP